jgi:beta-glucuronidase
LCLGLPDIVAYNIYPEWYAYPEWSEGNSTDKMYDDLYGWVQTSTEGAGKPFVIAEIGAGAIYGYHSPHKAKWSEERQAQILALQLPTLLGKDSCSGVFIWQYADVRVSEEWFAVRPRTMNNKGIVDEYRRPKTAYGVVKEIFGGDANASPDL